MRKCTHNVPSLTKGFTLVELLVAMGITSIIMLALFSIVGQTGTNYNLSQRKINQLSDARAFLHFIEADFSSRISGTKFHWKADETNVSRFAFTITRASEEFQTSPEQGDLTTVAYYYEYSNDDTRRTSPKVFRKKLSGKDTQKLLESGNTATFPAVDPAVDDAVLYNVVSFILKPLRRQPDGTYQAWLATDSKAPDAAELTIDVIDDFSAQKLQKQDQWAALAAATDPRQRQSIQRFTRLIPLTP